MRASSEKVAFAAFVLPQQTMAFSMLVNAS